MVSVEDCNPYCLACEVEWDLVTLGTRQVCMKVVGVRKGVSEGNRLCNEVNAGLVLPLSAAEQADFESYFLTLPRRSDGALLDITGRSLNYMLRRLVRL